MATIVTRSGKGSALTHVEMDANWNNLNNDKAELSGATFTGGITGTTLSLSGALSGAAISGTTLALTGALTTTSTIDGRDVAADGTKLDGIEASADVTDTTNVTAAGALMDSEVDADIKTLSLPANTTISAFGKTLVDDADAATARATLGAGQPSVFVNNADGSPNISSTQFNAPVSLTAGVWESVGPTGSGKTNIWTALDSVNSAADWIEVRLTMYGYSAATANTLYGSTLYARENGSSVAVATSNNIGKLNHYTNSSGNNTSQTIASIKIPVSSRSFDLHWTSTMTADTMQLYITGYGYNS